MVVQVPSKNDMHLLFQGLTIQLFQFTCVVGILIPMGWHCPCFLGAHRLGAVVAVMLEDRLREEGPLG